MPRLHGWRQDPESGWWSYGGSNFAASMWPSTGQYYPTGTSVLIWPRLGDEGGSDPTRPLGDGNPDFAGGELVFRSEAAARAYVESWERAVGR